MSAPPSLCQKLTSRVSLLCPRWATPGLRPTKAAPLHSCQVSVWGRGCVWSLLEDTLGAGVGTACAHSSHTPFLGDTPGTPVAQALRPRAPTSLPWQGLHLSCTQDGVPVTHSVRGEAPAPGSQGNGQPLSIDPLHHPQLLQRRELPSRVILAWALTVLLSQRVPWSSGVGGALGSRCPAQVSGGRWALVPGFMSSDSRIAITRIPAGRARQPGNLSEADGAAPPGP